MKLILTCRTQTRRRTKQVVPLVKFEFFSRQVLWQCCGNNGCGLSPDRPRNHRTCVPSPCRKFWKMRYSIAFASHALATLSISMVFNLMLVSLSSTIALRFPRLCSTSSWHYAGHHGRAPFLSRKWQPRATSSRETVSNLALFYTFFFHSQPLVHLVSRPVIALLSHIKKRKI